MKTPVTAYGIDFGTSNSAIAVLRDGAPQVLQLGSSGETTVPSLLYFPPSTGNFVIGEEAAAAYRTNRMQGRLLQSMKSLLTLPETHFGALAERFISSFLRELKARADQVTGTDVRTAVVGRPVIFSDHADEDQKAEEKLLAAVREAGFDSVRLLPEPIAAANSYQFDTRTPELILVADFGGGTSDYTLFRYSGQEAANGTGNEILGTSGVYTGGDEIDSAMMASRLGDFFGVSSSFNWYGKELPFPRHLVEMLSRPYLMPKLLRTKVFNMPLGEFLQDVTRLSDTPAAIGNFRTLLDKNLSFALFAAIERAKKGLSEQETETISFAEGGLRVEEKVTRPEMDEMITPQINRIWNCAQGLVETTGIAPAQIDRVILTGGTSLLSTIRERFVDHFGEEKVVQRNPFLSVVEGLALETGKVPE